jgi:hypothetical protein
MFGIGSSPGVGPAAKAQLDRIERKLNQILEHLGLDHDDPEDAFDLSAEERSLAAAGRKIEAIKQYRSRTNLGLKEAKDAVDAYLGS